MCNCLLAKITRSLLPDEALFSAFWLRSSVVSVLIVLIGRYGRTAAFPIIHFLKHGGTAELAHGPPRCPRHCTIALWWQPFGAPFIFLHLIMLIQSCSSSVVLSSYAYPLHLHILYSHRNCYFQYFNRSKIKSVLFVFQHNKIVM